MTGVGSRRQHPPSIAEHKHVAMMIDIEFPGQWYAMTHVPFASHQCRTSP